MKWWGVERRWGLRSRAAAGRPEGITPLRRRERCYRAALTLSSPNLPEIKRGFAPAAGLKYNRARIWRSAQDRFCLLKSVMRERI
jgi:hypothetical protein